MLKHAAYFIAGVLVVVAAQIIYALFSAHRALNTVTVSTRPVTATVTIRVSQDPQALRPLDDASELLDHINGLPDMEKQKIRDVLASGLVTEIRVEGDVAGESRWITVPATSSSFVMRGSSKATFGPVELEIEGTKKPNKAPEPTTTAVTSPAAQEPRQP